MSEPSAARRLHVLDGAAAVTPPPPLWEIVYREHVASVYRFIYARTGNRPDAEDLTSDTFMRALPRLAESASAGEVRGYLFTTARSVLADFWSQAYAIPVGGLEDLEQPEPGAGRQDVGADAAAGMPDDPSVARVAELLGRLSERQRAVLELRFLRGYTIKETAAALDLSVPNTKVIQWRALRLVAALDGEGTRS